MRTTLNIITILFVAASVYFVVSKNDIKQVPQLASQYFHEAVLEAEHLVNWNPTPSSQTQTYTGTAPTLSSNAPATGTAKVITPGPLQKITPASTPSTTTIRESGVLTRSGIIARTNTERRSNDPAVPVLTESSQLDASAMVKAKDILARQYFEHTAPDGRTVSDLVADQGYTYIKIGENLALGNFASDTDVVNAWMASPGHRANILDKAYTQIGVGVAFGNYQGHAVAVAVQHFGRPRSACPLVDTDLKAQVEAGQANLTTIVAALDALKKDIDEGRAQGKNMDSEITIYNQGIDNYKIEFDRVDALVKTYNAQVAQFNACLFSL